MKIGFCTFEQFWGRKNIGSTRIRARWVYENWGNPEDEVEEYKIGKEYDVLIFQKVYWPEFAKGFKGIKILDLCDPDWYEFGAKVVEMIECCDAVTCSSPALTDFIKSVTNKPVYYVADREDLSKLPTPKVHQGPIKKVAWFGYDHNNSVLDSALGALEKRDIELIVVSNKPYTKPSNSKVKITNYPWTELTVDQDLLRADLVLNPKPLAGPSKYKSENKTVHAWALGLPVAKTEDMLDSLNNPQVRQQVADQLRAKAFSEYDVKQSAKQYQEIIKSILDDKTN